MNGRIPVFTDDPGWHGQCLQRAFALRGYEAVFVSLSDCRLDLTQGSTVIVIPGFEKALPQGVFVRGVPGGTLQQVIARLDILHALQLLGVTVYNQCRAIERTVDKAMTSLLLHLGHISMPDTWVCESRQQAQSLVLRETMAGHTLVLKPLFGSQGQGVRRLDSSSAFPLPMDEHVDGLYYLQRFIDSGEGAWHDYRVFVINGKAVAAMKRYGNGWVNNMAQGASCESLSLGSDIAELALAAAQAVDIDYCGVDIIRDQQGRLYVLEVNSIPAWKGLQGVTELNIAQALIDDFLFKMNSGAKHPDGPSFMTLGEASSSVRLAAAYKSACLAELEALKPGNIHIFADGHGMVVEDFIHSAEASAAVITQPGLTVGQRISSAIEASWAVVNCNTNLGMVLLCAPIIHAALRRGVSLQKELQMALQELTIADAELTFRAILQASPAGLGEGMQHDVHKPPDVTLLEAMQAAEDRDLVARQYSNNFADIFDFGVVRYRECLLRWQRPSWAITAVYLGFMARFPDSHIVRKHGETTAIAIQDEAAIYEKTFLKLENPKTCQRELLRFDADLKRRGLNPGTSADLTVASLLAASLEAPGS